MGKTEQQIHVSQTFISNSYIQIYFLGSDVAGKDISQTLPSLKGVKQGYVLEPLLYIFYINVLVNSLSNPNFHLPKLDNHKISLLMYVDDIAILPRTPVVLRRALKTFAHYCEVNVK